MGVQEGIGRCVKGISSKKKKPSQHCEKAKESYPHFRYYKKSRHPALITDEHSEDEYKYRKVMHSEKDGKRRNEKVFPNPNPTDKLPMYIGKRIRHDKKKHFEKNPLPWKYPVKKKK